MTDDDRALILGIVRGALAEKAPIVVTHGTDTIVETGLYFERALTELTVTIVFTGAMTPLGFEGSDGLQNQTESLSPFGCFRRESTSSSTDRSFPSAAFGRIASGVGLFGPKNLFLKNTHG